MMIGGMNNGDILHIMLNTKAHTELIKQLSKYDEEIQDIIRKLLKTTEPVSYIEDIDVSYELTNENRLSLIIYGEMLISILKRIDRTEDYESMVVLPYCIYYNTYKDNSKINQTFTNYLNDSIDTMPRVPYESVYDV